MGLVTVEIANQTNSEGDVVQIIAVDVTAIDLPAPSISYFDLSITGGGAVADDKMIGQPVSHSADMPMIVIEHARISLPRAAVMDDDEFPAITRQPGPV